MTGKPRMQGMSEREYARRVGLSRGAIQKAKRSGRLVLFADGSIDPEASDRRMRATTHPGRSFAARMRHRSSRAPTVTRDELEAWLARLDALFDGSPRRGGSR
ncbi:MAG: hypothetical protein WHV64_18155 [Geminicoccaceae bacterium]